MSRIWMVDDKGNTAIEYALIIFLVSLGMITALITCGVSIKYTFCVISSEITSGTTGDCNGSLSNTVNSNYLTSGEGGTGSIDSDNDNSSQDDSSPYFATGADGNTSIQQILDQLNAKDPITGIYGVYDPNTGDALNTYQKMSDFLGKDDNTHTDNDWKNPSAHLGLTDYGEDITAYSSDYNTAEYGHFFQIQTQSGATYYADYVYQNPESTNTEHGVGHYSIIDSSGNTVAGEKTCNFMNAC